MPLAFGKRPPAPIKPKKKENQVGHSPERAVEGQEGRGPPRIHSPGAEGRAGFFFGFIPPGVEWGMGIFFWRERFNFARKRETKLGFVSAVE